MSSQFSHRQLGLLIAIIAIMTGWLAFFPFPDSTVDTVQMVSPELDQIIAASGQP